MYRLKKGVSQDIFLNSRWERRNVLTFLHARRDNLAGDGILACVDFFFVITLLQFVFKQHQANENIDPVMQGVDTGEHTFQEELYECGVGCLGFFLRLLAAGVEQGEEVDIPVAFEI